MEQWIGSPKITARLLPKLGDRDDFEIRAIGPGSTDYNFPLSITRTILSIWGSKSEDVAIKLANGLLGVYGTAKAPPEEGFWFDSYNSGTTVKETLDRISNEGIAPFTRAKVNQEFIQQFGSDLFEVRDDLNRFFSEKFGFEFFRSFDDAFEDSQALEDLNNPPKDKAHFLYRICILSVFIDHFSVRLTSEQSGVGSLQAFKSWLSSETSESEAKNLIQVFQMVKNLRKQYPLHEEYDVASDGNRTIRREITDARTFFSLNNNDYETDWSKVIGKFKGGLETVKTRLSN